MMFLVISAAITTVYGGKTVMDRTEYFPKIDVNVSWSINTDTQSIYIELIAPIFDDLSWIAFGLSDTGGMKGADMALVSLYDDSVYDLHSIDFVLPQMDKIQNWKLMHLERGQTHSLIQMKRRLLTCDEEDFSIKTDRAKHNLMIAYHPKDYVLPETTEWKLKISQHPFYERRQVSLFVDDGIFMAHNDENENYIDYTIDSLTVSKTEGVSQYWCQLFNITERRYLTGYEPLDTTVSKVMHHAVLHKCENAEFDPTPKQCTSGVDYRFDMECEIVMIAASSTSWSFQSEIFYLLEPGIYNLEIHFDLATVPARSDVQVTGSGLRAYYSDTPRARQLGY